MPDQDTREILLQLRQEIERTPTDDPARQEVLDHIKSQIDQAVAGQAEDDDHPKSLLDRVREAVNEFSSEHPDLTAAIDRALAILNTGGI